MCIDVVVRAENSLQEAVAENCKALSVSNTSAPCIVPFITSYLQELLLCNFAYRKFIAFLRLSEMSDKFHLTIYRKLSSQIQFTV